MKKKPMKAKESYVISVSLMKGCYRHLRIDSHRTLAELSDAILSVFEFDEDHLHAFYMDNKKHSMEDAYISAEANRDHSMNRDTERLARLNLTVGKQFKYLFDFGDEWCFQCKVLKVLEETTACTTLVRSVGDAPEQYPEEEWFDDATIEYEAGDGDDDDDDDEVEISAATARASASGAASDSARSVLLDGLYDLMFRYKKTRLWEKMTDSEIFAVRHADGAIGYCSVLGVANTYLGMALYPGDGGLATRRLLGRYAPEEFERLAVYASMDCIIASFEGKSELSSRELEAVNAYCAVYGVALRGRRAYPQFQRFRPRYIPWQVEDETDRVHLCEALEAALEVAKKLDGVSARKFGFVDGPLYDREIPLLEKKEGEFVWSRIALPAPLPEVYPSPEVRDEASLAKLIQSGKPGTEWACAVATCTTPVLNEEDMPEVGEEPRVASFFQYMLLIVDNVSEESLSFCCSDGPTDYAEEFIADALDAALRAGKPTRILVRDARTYALFEKFAERLDVELVTEKSIPSLDEAEREAQDVFRDEPDDMQALDALRNPELYDHLSNKQLRVLLKAADQGVLPDDIEEIVRREVRRRGIK